MKTKKNILNMDQLDIDDFAVVAIHSNLEAYLVAYRLNENLGCLLHNSAKKAINDIYTRFKYIPKIENETWELISNHYKNEEKFSKKNLLFSVNKTNKKSIFIISHSGSGTIVKGKISKGESQPPKNSIEPNAHINKMLAYSPNQNIAYIIPEYSVW